MKKILLTICLAAASLTTFAQTEKTVTYGIYGSFNLASLSVTTSGSSSTANSASIPTFSVGALADIPFADKWSIQPGLMFTGKGGKENLGNNVTYKVNLYYLQMPVNVMYHAPVSYGEFSFGAGPYLGYGLSAKESVTDGKNTESINLDFGNAEDEYKPIDLGLSLIIALKLNSGVYFALNSDIGLTNIINLNSVQNYNRVSRLSIGYSF